MITSPMQLTLLCVWWIASAASACSRAEDVVVSIRTESLPASAARYAQPPLPANDTGDQSDAALAAVQRLDKADGYNLDSSSAAQLSAEEHLRRAAVYTANRLFAEARMHWQLILTRHPTSQSVPAALFGIGRSHYQERQYEAALPVFERLAREHPNTKEGRDGFYYVAPTLLRMERAGDAAKRYQEYTERFPQGERIEDAYLNLIDSLREAGRPAESAAWIDRTRQRFAGRAAEINAVFARLRLAIGSNDWQSAVRTCDELLTRLDSRQGVSTTGSEVGYLRAYSLEQLGQVDQAAKAYLAIPDRANSYYGGLATKRLQMLSSNFAKQSAAARTSRVESEIIAQASNYPAPYREIILRSTTSRKVDPRLMLAIMRQESSFRPGAKSGSAARGLMQLTTDTAAKYSDRVGLRNLREADFYRPETSILLASEYLATLNKLFTDLPEAVAASYNGGEDNAVRWRRRAGGQVDPGLFAAEVGFAETKDYVFKVMANYRAYRQLYTGDLQRRR